MILIAAVIVLGIALLIALIRLARGTNWREVFSTFASTFLVGLVFLAIMFLSFVSLPKTEEPLAVEPLPMPTPLLASPLGPVPPLVIWLVAGGILLTAAFLGY
jgi:type II secretory pathway pseudopilin PulG